MEGAYVCQFTNICVFCGSNPGKDRKFLKAAHTLGRVLAEKKIHLVFGGGGLGLMGVVSLAAHIGGSQVLSVIPRALTTTNITRMTIGLEIQVSIMHECISKMLEKFDAFIALPGGYGFISHSARQLLVSTSTADELIDKLQRFVYELDPVMAQLDWFERSSKKRRFDLT
ncbi:hypothetical protein FNV43_RR19708 [Rhamnella rubrinervis]|uniref:cytokinin riboside 5'-monophosphate phosphoribohydrolase n=1 Tax=Rhamnella rubrinervis TaxID=2594499 RepID=A0A8K0DTH9_9ROSA|nr:hypothetical protein FNV43_RR19708 [Rhamnella rubrinervis]